jgi:histidinol-phosphate aminotransferase
VRRYAAEVRRARSEFEKVLTRLGHRWFPSAGNFLLVDFGARGPEMLRRLAREGILLSDRSREFRRPGMVRVSITTRAEMRRLAAAVQRLARK